MSEMIVVPNWSDSDSQKPAQGNISPWAPGYSDAVAAREQSDRDASRQAMIDRLVEGGNFAQVLKGAEAVFTEHHNATLDFAGKPKAAPRVLTGANGERTTASSFYPALEIMGVSYDAQGNADYETHSASTFKMWLDRNGVPELWDCEGLTVEDAETGGKVAKLVLSRTAEGDHFPSEYAIEDMRTVEQFNLDNGEELHRRKKAGDLGRVASEGAAGAVAEALDTTPRDGTVELDAQQTASQEKSVADRLLEGLSEKDVRALKNFADAAADKRNAQANAATSQNRDEEHYYGDQSRAASQSMGDALREMSPGAKSIARQYAGAVHGMNVAF